MNSACPTLLKILTHTCAALTLSSSLSIHLIADDATWNGAGSGDSWATAGNWVDAIVPGATSGFTNQDEAIFDTTGAGSVEVDTGRNLRYITFAVGSIGDYTFSGEALHMSHDGVIYNYNTNNEFQNDLVLHAADNTSAGQFEIRDHGYQKTLDFSGGISAGETTETVTLNLRGNNSYAVTFSGVLADHSTSGALALNIDHGSVLSGGQTTLSAVNTYTGGTTVNSGKVAFTNDSAFGTGAITWNGGEFRDSAGTLANDIVLNGQIGMISSSVTFEGAVSLGLDASIYANTGTQTFNGVISDGAGSTFLRTGHGTVILNAANTFTGGFIMDTLESRQLRLGHDQALGTGTFVIKGGQITGESRTLANAIEWDGSLVMINTSYTFNGDIALGNDAALDPYLTSNSSGQTFNGVISDGSVTGKALTIHRFGTMTFNGANTFTGGIISTGQGLRLGHDQALGTGTLTLLGNEHDTRVQILLKSIPTIHIDNDIVLDGRHNAVHLESASGWNFNGNLTLGTDEGLTPTLSFTGMSESAVFNGVVSNGNAAAVFTKEGSGTIIFGNDNTLTGDVVVAGGTLQIGNGGSTGLVGTSAVTVDDASTLRFNRTGAYTAVNAIDGAGDLEIQGGGSASFSGALTHTGGTRVTGSSDLRIDGSFNGGDGISVEAGSTFGGSGSVELSSGELTLAAGAFLSAGSESTRGVLNIENTVVDLAAVRGEGTGALVFRLGGEADSDRIDFGGTSTIILVGGTGEGLTFGDFAFSTDVDFTGGEYLLFENVSFFLGEELVSGETTGLINGYEAELFYVDNGLGGGDISLSVVVPEPAAAASLLGLLSLAGVSMRRRRRV